MLCWLPNGPRWPNIMFAWKKRLKGCWSFKQVSSNPKTKTNQSNMTSSKVKLCRPQMSIISWFPLRLRCFSWVGCILDSLAIEFLICAKKTKQKWNYVFKVIIEATKNIIPSPINIASFIYHNIIIVSKAWSSYFSTYKILGGFRLWFFSSI